MENGPKAPKKSLNRYSVGVQLILLAPLETFNLTSGKQFLHKLKIIQSKLCKYIRSDKGGGGRFIVRLKNLSQWLKLNRGKRS